MRRFVTIEVEKEYTDVIEKNRVKNIVEDKLR